MTDDSEAQGSGARLIRLLQYVAEAGRDLSLKELADQVSLPPSTVHRLLQLLVKTEMVERGEAQTYRPGRELVRTASLVLQNFNPAKVARPFLRALWDGWQESCTFCVYRPTNRTLMVAARLASPHRLQYVIEVFDPIPLVWGSLGRAVLAQLPNEEIAEAVANAKPGQLTGRAPPKLEVVMDDVRLIRERGYALYYDPEKLDVAAVAAPVFGADGLVAGSLGIAMPASRFDRPDNVGLPPAVVEQAAQLSQALGYLGPRRR